ncbi:MAG: hypothetical protein M1828_006161 [Chrysothrix sp. TS-e1954]|nr:MAG: hypothetical protein M1828_006161 [Chrysothrix sp. TS-e1954]
MERSILHLKLSARWGSKFCVAAALRPNSHHVQSWPACRHLQTSSKPSKIADFAFVFDIDGVLVRGSKSLPRAAKTLASLRRQRVPFLLLTNGGGYDEERRAEKLTEEIGFQLHADDIVQSHTPFEAMSEYKSKRVLVVGGEHNNCKEVARKYGYKNVVTPSDIYAQHPEIWPFSNVLLPYHQEHALPLTSRITSTPTPDNLKIDAIFVYNDPRDWGLDMSLIVDCLLSHQGYLGTLSPQNNNDILPNRGYQQDGQPPLFFSNPDMWFASTFSLPRLGQGGFQAALDGLWSGITGGLATGVKLQKTIIGKPYRETYGFAERKLDERRRSSCSGQGTLPPLKHVVMVGDNPGLYFVTNFKDDLSHLYYQQALISVHYLRPVHLLKDLVKPIVMGNFCDFKATYFFGPEHDDLVPTSNPPTAKRASSDDDSDESSEPKAKRVRTKETNAKTESSTDSKSASTPELKLKLKSEPATDIMTTTDRVKKTLGSRGREQRGFSSGQRGFLPVGMTALASLSEELASPDLDDESDEYAKAYLMHVREEAQGLQLIGKQSHDEDTLIYGSGLGDARGFFSDGAYIAAPIVKQSQLVVEQVSTSLSPQVAASNSILSRFDAQRALLSSPGPKMKVPRSLWGRTHGKPTFITMKPTPVLLASISQDQALMLIERLTPLLTNSTLFTADSQAYRVLGPWALGLLARVAEVETLFRDDVSTVRELAKRAAEIARNAGGNDEDVSISGKESLKILRSWGPASKPETQQQSEETVAQPSETPAEADEDQRVLEVLRQQVLARLEDDNDDEPGTSESAAAAKAGIDAADDAEENQLPPTAENDEDHQYEDEDEEQNDIEDEDEIRTPPPRRRNTSSPLSRSPSPLLPTISTTAATTKTSEPAIPPITEAPHFPAIPSAQSTYGSLHLLEGILCIVGDRYGQSDLLSVRERIWAPST